MGSEMGSAVMRSSRSATEKPSKNESEKMASGNASFLREKVLRK
jgi:hypothetical protein